MIGKDHVTFKQPSVCTAFIHMLVFITFALILGTDSFAKLNIQSELSLAPTVPTPIQHVESGKLPPM